jgi:hypothetical protein
MKKYRIKRDEGRDIVFTGHLIGTAETSPDNTRRDYSGSTGRWQELELYKTDGGKYVCSRMHGTQWQSERDHYEAAICENEVDVINFFGLGGLAKELYDLSGIDSAEVVE